MTILLSSQIALTQSTVRLAGRVLDDLTGEPINRASVEICNSSYRTETDSQGHFAFANLPPGRYRIVARADGYDDQSNSDITVVTDVTTTVSIRLAPTPFPVDGIVVQDRWVDAAEMPDVKVINRQEIAYSRSADLGQLLQDVEGVNVTRFGNGSAKVSIRGSDAKHVLVLLDGNRLNAAGDGEADINAVPLSVVERIEIHKGGGASRFGSDALAGVVNIVTHPRGVADESLAESRNSLGAWGARDLSVTFSNPLSVSRLNLRGAIEFQQSRGDFPFSYSVAPNPRTYEGTRVNNSFRSKNLFLSGSYQVSDRSTLGFSAQRFDSHNGLPDRASQQNEIGERNDDRLLLSTSWNTDLSRTWRLTGSLGWSDYTQVFVDTTDPSPSNRYHSRYSDRRINLQMSAEYRTDLGTVLSLGTQTRWDRLDHTDEQMPSSSMGASHRTSTGVFCSGQQRFRLGWPVIDQATISTSVRYDHSRTDKQHSSILGTVEPYISDEWSPGVGVSMTKSVSPVKLTGRATYNRAYRLPSANALFWSGDVRARGNPGLRPERSENSEVGIDAEIEFGPVTVTTSATYFHSRVTDLIEWVQAYANTWKPVNLAAARRTGHEELLTVSAFNRLATITYGNTVTDSRNLIPDHTVFNKQLIHSPHYVQTVRAGLNHRVFFGSYSVRSVGRRYATASNSKYYDSYSIHDWNAGLRAKPFQPLVVEFEYRVQNATDEDYVLITHYPMPGRTWTVGVNLTYNLQDYD